MPRDESRFIQIPYWKLYLVAFTAGAVVMSVELSGSRLVAPFLGSSLHVWTSLIGIILAFLSLGYLWGGRLADRNPHAIFAVLLGAGSSLLIVPLIEIPALYLLSRTISDIRVAAVCAATLFFALPSFLLGSITPLTARLALGPLQSSGSRVGYIFAISTLGSIVGTFATGFFLFSWLSTPILLQFLSAVLFLLAFSIQPSRRCLPFALLAILGISHLLQSEVEKIVENRGVRLLDTRYHRIILQDIEQANGQIYRALITDPFSTQSSTLVGAPEHFTSTYGRFYSLGIQATGATGQYLMIGGGAMSFPKYFAKKYPDAMLEVVEIDPELITIAKEHFGFQTAKNLSVHTLDGRRYLHRSRKKYRAIFLDVFKSSSEMPFHLATREFFELCKTHLDADGFLFINSIGSAKGAKAQLIQSLSQTVQQAFHHVDVFLVSSPNKPKHTQNIVIVAGNQALNAKALGRQGKDFLKKRYVEVAVSNQSLILSDDFAPIESLMTPTYLDFQKSRRRKINLDIR